MSHSKTGGSKDQFLYENIVASYGLQQIGLKIEVTNHQNFEIFNFSDWAPALSIACHDAFFCLKHTHIISCKKKKIKKKNKNPLRDKHSRVRISLKETKRSRPFIIYFPREDKLTFTFQFFLHEVLFNVYLVGNLLWSLVKIFAENVARGNSVQIGPNFPAKSLSIYNKTFS